MTYLPNRRGVRGMTLLELLMAIVVFSLGLVALMGLFGMANSMNAKSKDTMFAIDAATRALEQVRGEPFDAVAASTTYTEAVEECSTMNVTIEANVDPDFADLKRITVDVQWDERSRGQVQLQTIVGAPMS